MGICCVKKTKQEMGSRAKKDPSKEEKSFPIPTESIPISISKIDEEENLGKKQKENPIPTTKKKKEELKNHYKENQRSKIIPILNNSKSLKVVTQEGEALNNAISIEKRIQNSSEIRKRMSIKVNKAKKGSKMKLMQGVEEIPLNVQERIKKQQSMKLSNTKNQNEYEVITLNKSEEKDSTSAFSKEVMIIRNRNISKTPQLEVKSSTFGKEKKYQTNANLFKKSEEIENNLSVLGNESKIDIKKPERCCKKIFVTLVDPQSNQERGDGLDNVIDFTEIHHQIKKDIIIKEPSFETLNSSFEGKSFSEVKEIREEKKPEKEILESEFHSQDSIDVSSSYKSEFSQEWKKSAIAEQFEKSRNGEKMKITKDDISNIGSPAKIGELKSFNSKNIQDYKYQKRFSLAIYPNYQFTGGIQKQ